MGRRWAFRTGVVGDRLPCKDGRRSGSTISACGWVLSSSGGDKTSSSSRSSVSFQSPDNCNNESGKGKDEDERESCGRRCPPYVGDGMCLGLVGPRLFVCFTARGMGGCVGVVCCAWLNNPRKKEDFVYA